MLMMMMIIVVMTMVRVFLVLLSCVVIVRLQNIVSINILFPYIVLYIFSRTMHCFILTFVI